MATGVSLWVDGFFKGFVFVVEYYSSVTANGNVAYFRRHWQFCLNCSSLVLQGKREDKYSKDIKKY